MIKIQFLQFQYPGAQQAALNALSFSVKTGSLFGLVGPNGAGKTTLLSILTCLLPCAKKTVYIDGIDISTAPEGVKLRLSLVPQEYAFYPTLSVIENLRFFAGIQRIPAAQISQRIAEAVKLTGLRDRLNNRAQHLSGGLKRRLNIAIGLLNKPKLLFLDEPTVGIDPQSRRFILDAIKGINKQGTTVIYTSHYMEEVEYLCDHIAVIDNGQLLLKGALAQLLQAGQALNIELAQPLTDIQQQQLSHQFSIHYQDRQLKLMLTSSEEFYQLMATLAQLNIIIARLHYGSRNLEERFLQLTGKALRD